MVFLAFTSYDAARSGAEAEALVVAQQVETAQFFPAPAAGDSPAPAGLLRPLRGGRARRILDGGRHLGAGITRRLGACSETLEPVDPRTPPEQSAFNNWLDQTCGAGIGSQ